MELKELPNIGDFLMGQLHQVGITTKEQLEAIGSEEAWLKIQAIDPSACYHRLCALEGAIQGIPKKDLKETDKEHLRAFYRTHKKSDN